MKNLTRLTQIAVAVCTLWNSGSAFAATEQQLLRCSDTQFEQGAYGQYYGMTYHGTDSVCGGDDLGSGTVGINDDGTIHVTMTDANHDPFVMYEVYWIPVGQDPVTHRVMVGNILTDCDGNADNTLRDISSPADQYSGAEVDITARVGNKDAGNFYFYSRGPYGHNDDGTCQPLNYNTSDNTENGTVNNPVLWGSTSNPLFDGVQFISGYEITGSGSGLPFEVLDTTIINPDGPMIPTPGPFPGGEGEGEGEPMPPMDGPHGPVDGCPLPPVGDMPEGEAPQPFPGGEMPQEFPEGDMPHDMPEECQPPVPAP